MEQKYNYVFDIIVHDDFLSDGEKVMVVHGPFSKSARIHFSPAMHRIAKRNESVVCWIQFLEGDLQLNVGDPILIENSDHAIVRGYGKVLPYNEEQSERD